MLTYVGIAFLVIALTAAMFFLVKHKLSNSAFSVMAVASIVGGLVIGNFDSFRKIAVSWGEGKTLSVDLQEKVEFVDTTAKEVRSLMGQVELLVATANATNAKIEKNAKTVSELVADAREIRNQVNQSRRAVEEMAGGLRQTWISFIETMYFDFSTRNIIPPTKEVMAEVERHINILARLAIPDPNERARWVAAMNKRVQRIKNPNPPK